MKFFAVKDNFNIISYRSCITSNINTMQMEFIPCFQMLTTRMGLIIYITLNTDLMKMYNFIS